MVGWPFGSGVTRRSADWITGVSESFLLPVRCAHMGWTMFYLFVMLKLPIIAAIWLVWWAVKQEPDPSEDVRDDGGAGKRQRPHPSPRLPRTPRRGPHGGRRPSAPPRVRPLRARGRDLAR